MEFDELKGLMYINDTDIYASYHAFLCEEDTKDFTNYNELLKASSVKTVQTVDIREENGEKSPDDLTPQNQARDFTLTYALHGDNESAFIAGYISFVKFLKAGKNGTGWLDIKLSDFPADHIIHCYMKEAGDYKNYTPMGDNLVAAQVKITFHEPQPLI